eukprot:PhF_6_TR6245/c0_g1_i1/m.9441
MEGERKSSEVLIGTKLYDVANFRHPGGSIVKFLAGNGDATDAFTQFHNRSTKASKMLATLPCRDAPAGCRGINKDYLALTNDFAKLNKELEQEGWFKASPTHIFYRISELVVMHLVGLLLFCTWAWPVGIFILGIASGRCGWLMHEAGHYSLTTNIKIDRYLQEMIYGLGCGMSGGWWRSQHNRHHAVPQKLQHDVDLDTLPLVSFNRAISKVVKHPIGKAWIRHQAKLFAPVTCLLVCLGWQFFLHLRFVNRTKNTREAFWLGLRMAMICTFLHYTASTFSSAVGCFLLYDWVGATYIFCNFALSHTHLPVSKPDEFLHWVEYSSNHTTNLAPHWFTNWWMGYLNFQIEHHLFPAMPQYRFPRLSPRIQKFFKDHGLKYDCRGYFAAVGDTFRNLEHVGNEL